VRRAHQLKLGVDYRWLAPFVRPVGTQLSCCSIGITADNGPEGRTLRKRFPIDGRHIPVPARFCRITFNHCPGYLESDAEVDSHLWAALDVNPALKGKTRRASHYRDGLDDPATMTIALAARRSIALRTEMFRAEIRRGPTG